MAPLQPLRPLDTTPLFDPLHGELLTLLRGLEAEDWQRPTVAPKWRVKDIAAHLLDTQLRTLSTLRDGHLLPPDRPIDGYRDLVDFLNQLNADWVKATARLSPRVLVDLLADSGPQVAELFRSMDLHATALFSVAWAGEEESENWMHIGREYTEWWHHQMQIRDAVGAPAVLLERRWLAPLLDISVRVLPHTYRETEGSDGTSLVFTVSGQVEQSWSLVWRGRGGRDEGWKLLEGAAADPSTTVRADPDTAWKLLYHALKPQEAEARATVEGDRQLAAPLFGARSVMV